MPPPWILPLNTVHVAILLETIGQECRKLEYNMRKMYASATTPASTSAQASAREAIIGPSGVLIRFS